MVHTNTVLRSDVAGIISSPWIGHEQEERHVRGLMLCNFSVSSRYKPIYVGVDSGICMLAKKSRLWSLIRSSFRHSYLTTQTTCNPSSSRGRSLKQKHMTILRHSGKPEPKDNNRVPNECFYPPRLLYYCEAVTTTHANSSAKSQRSLTDNMCASTNQSEHSPLPSANTPARGGDLGVVVLVGMTGSGKSTFVSRLAKYQQDEVEIGHSLGSSMSNTKASHSGVDPKLTPMLPAGTVNAAKYTVYDNNGCAVCVIDTPGFGDTTRSDAQILQEIAGQLMAIDSRGEPLLGIICLHRITDVRLSHSALRCFNILQRLCGAEVYNRIILATTMWSTIATGSEEQDSANRRQEQLKKYWDKLFNEKGLAIPHQDSTESAWDIVGRLRDAARGATAVKLKIQRELTEEGLTLDRTEVGLYIQQEGLRKEGNGTDGEQAQENERHDKSAHQNHGRIRHYLELLMWLITWIINLSSRLWRHMPSFSVGAKGEVDDSALAYGSSQAVISR